MNRLPREIISSILAYRDADKSGCLDAAQHCYVSSGQSGLTPYVTISRQWQYEVERINLRHIEFKSTELPVFANLFRPSQSHRTALLKTLSFDIVLPTYSEAACGEYETGSEKETNSQVFSEAIFELFKILKSLDGGEFVLYLDSYSPMNSHKRPEPRRKRDRLLKDIRQKRYQASFLQLKAPEQLPVLSNVSEFHDPRSCPSRNIEPASDIAIVSRMENLKKCDLHFSDRDDKIDLGLRKINRNNLAQVLSAYTQTVKEVTFEFNSGDPDDEGSSPPLLSPSSVDSLNLALHKFIGQANVERMLIIHHIVSPDLFWPSHSTTAWQCLRQIRVLMLASTVDGGWYFKADPSIASYAQFTDRSLNPDYSDPYDSDEDTDTNRFRSLPDPERINQLLIAMARAAHHAPVLETMELSIREGRLYPKYREDEDVSRIFGICYYAQGAREKFKTTEHKARLICRVGDRSLDGEVERHWRNVLSPDGVIIYN
ncbi:hypothetical protein AJ79_06848 [Helicocarpus griseus UAMH5409]|uniref:F-box domain-containing protein n=1 Tax=Helicocarpus griseus UAMH5409 TaxID=1447875 RepID=A0A2B7X946_9EURO|nr:hypothetical protein AJ79_06848 [Helicocarpus griseus UAMH5409]